MDNMSGLTEFWQGESQGRENWKDQKGMMMRVHRGKLHDDFFILSVSKLDNIYVNHSIDNVIHLMKTNVCLLIVL